MSAAVVKIIKEKENLVRNTFEKNCVMVFGLKEEEAKIKHMKEKREKNIVEKIVKKVEEEDGRISALDLDHIVQDTSTGA